MNGIIETLTGQVLWDKPSDYMALLTLIVSAAAFGLSVKLAKEARLRQQGQTLSLIQEFGSRPDFMEARAYFRNRTPTGKPLAKTDTEGRRKADLVCVCYDQIGALLDHPSSSGVRDTFLRSSWGVSVVTQHRWLAAYLDEHGGRRRRFFKHFEKLAEDALDYVDKELVGELIPVSTTAIPALR